MSFEVAWARDEEDTPLVKSEPPPTPIKSTFSPEGETYHLFVDNLRFWSMVGIVGMHGFRTDQWVLLPVIVWQLVLTPLKFSTIAFFLAAGFLLGNRLETLEPMHYLSRRLRRVFLPWLVWTVLFSFLVLVSSIGHHKISGDLTPALLSAFAEKLFISVTGTAFWFVPNLFVGLTLLLMLRRHLDSLWLGFGLLAIDLFYVVNIYCRWIPSRHTQAVFGFVFYLWLGRYASRHYERLQDWLRRTSMGVLIPAILLLGIFAFAESRILVHTEAIDSANTLRLTNQAYSIAVVLMIMKIRRVTWPHFMNVRRYTFGIYLSHTVMLAGILSCLRRYSPATFLVALRQSVSLTLLTEIIVTCLVYFLCVGITAVLAETPHLQWVVGCNPRSRAAKKAFITTSLLCLTLSGLLGLNGCGSGVVGGNQSTLAAAPATYSEALNSTSVFVGASIVQNWKMPMHNNGIGGQTTSEVLARFQADVIGQGYARVVILCGTNDALQNTSDLVAVATANLKAMARMARDAGVEVVLSQLPPIVLNDLATSKIQALNGSIAQLAAENGYLLVDYFMPMQGHPEYFNTDGIHPNATGYAVMEKALAAVVRH